MSWLGENPRAIALAEVARSAKENKNYDDFVKPLLTTATCGIIWKVNYAKHLFVKK